ncbi:MAG: UDP-N-acetylmuramoyl-tripeptide--D-alanyl-D-alanine ligase [Flavobacteriales bacterium]|nr:UDP-N-acetylmuramoyl-tripeptide--D-alanyl-D-alanine ligase [Flavobacteriales bacterium]MBP6641459.1 UDP-N-acetylmuramoyl-tripeptide--D-alanyl-D-alanine ligase [Flavobacteriales bacterium]MBP7155331.1 UDP-N-acetylmuramoyl-tripeptide--D-alanyl-D-alanine ligase [Flavobacteriales bacterium]HQV74326.1 UDP-N-acetylmuramoyl-tripeptide--D-alanyl-D-alanine ligase [Flavobacteriales bacterium]HQW40102.1 UDP-N-acetylmuramoyl-tripeptide--D-alanyl-D-alanine ligase [Flavobacteriales bacterium]
MTTLENLYSRFLECSGVCTDTRNVLEGGLFIALKGPNFNANGFAKEALEKGSRFVVVDDPDVVLDERFLLVKDGLSALQNLATHHRRHFTIPVIGITGTNGKTTTKELVHAVLGADRPTLATIGNLNNHIGVPLTLLRLTKEHRIAIIEMGANKIGDIAELVAIAEPTYGAITNVGKAHLEGFGSFEGVVTAKTEMYQYIQVHSGSLFVNADDDLLMAKSKGAVRVTYGRDLKANTVGNASGSGPFLEITFTGHNGSLFRATTRLIGDYNLHNALLAVAIGQHFNVPDQRIADSLTAYVPSNNRSQFTDTGKNELILDAYNANPTSMKAALENFAAIRTDRPKLMILGDMRELGAESAQEHSAIVDLAERLSLETVFIGTEFEKVRKSGYVNVQDLLIALKDQPVTGKLILVKGSRGIKLETVVGVL